MRKHTKAIIAVIAALLLFLILNQPAYAAPAAISISVEAGLDGKVKRGKGFPLTIKAENTGEAFSGDLLIDFHPSYNSGGAMSIKANLPENSSKTFHITIPGNSEDHPSSYQNLPAINLYKGSWKDGNKVKFSGDTKLKAKYIEGGEMTMGILSEDYDRLKELRILPSAAVETLELKKEQLPEEGLGLEMLDYLLLDEFAVSDLTEAQQNAIKDWVGNGGILIAGAAPDAGQSLGVLYTLLPMKPDKEGKSSASFLADKGENEPPFKELPMFYGPVENQAEILSLSGNVPAAVKADYGSGTILQTAFSLGDEPLSSWTGYSRWFGGILQSVPAPSAAGSQYGPDIYDPLTYEFAEANEYFPASSFSIGQLLLLLIGYIIVIVPILYFILKKRDKREHAWWIIPSLAVLMSVAIFGIGAKDRLGQPQVNQLGVYKAVNSQLIGIQAATLLSNTSGEYAFSVPSGEFNAIPSTLNRPGTDHSGGGVIEQSRKETRIVFNAVEYWSSRTIFGKSQKEKEGGLEADLTLKDKRLSGTVTNSFPYDFEELYIWTGSNKIKIGSLKKGESLKVDEKVKNDFLTAPYMSGAGYGYPGPNQDLDLMKKERLEYAASAFLFSGSGTAEGPMLAGLTKDSVIEADLLSKKEKISGLNLIFEPFEAKVDFTGEFSLSNEVLDTELEAVQGMVYEKNVNGSKDQMMADDGEYQFIASLPAQVKGKSLAFSELSVSTKAKFAEYAVLNHESGEMEPFESKLTIQEDIGRYIGKDGKVVVRIIKTSKDPQITMPKITIKGEAS
ncbi:hypothetical protein KZX50_11980 [Bacillus infantis]|uniref:hypothetical protein n=1 Tax=Bacillus infantis TaxID=324767 RepID=UPI002006AC6C|nr:hypothetical protein [Bacillus infantis]MCK6206164.1 hypothetical protein [Bacillus infantis]